MSLNMEKIMQTLAGTTAGKLTGKVIMPKLGEAIDLG